MDQFSDKPQKKQTPPENEPLLAYMRPVNTTVNPKTGEVIDLHNGDKRAAITNFTTRDNLDLLERPKEKATPPVELSKNSINKSKGKVDYRDVYLKASLSANRNRKK